MILLSITSKAWCFNIVTPLDRRRSKAITSNAHICASLDKDHLPEWWEGQLFEIPLLFEVNGMIKYLCEPIEIWVENSSSYVEPL